MSPQSTESRSPVTPLTPIATGNSTGCVGTETQNSSRKRGFSSTVHARQKRKVTRACDVCKAKKAKCSGTQPCESCAQRGFTCLYEARYSRGKPPTPPQTDPARSRLAREPHDSLLPRSADTAQFSERSYASTTFNPPMVSNFVPTADRAAPQRPSNLHDQIQEERRRYEAQSSTMQQPPGRGEQEVPSRGSPELEVAGQYSDSTSGLSFLHRAWRRLSNNQNSQLMNGVLGSSENDQLLMAAGDKPFQYQGQVTLPPLAKCKELLRLYFDVCIATYRLLHRPTVERWLELVLDNSQSQTSTPLWHGSSRPKTAIVLSVLAIATFHEGKARGAAVDSSSSCLSLVDEEPSLQQCDELFCEASRLTDTETGFPRLESAQARLIQVLYLLMSSRMNRAWYTFGHALQIISALGLHRREERKRPSQKHDYIEAQCRKRTFWVAYTLDKYLGVIFGRPRHYHDDDIDQDFPDPVNDEDMSPTGPLVGGSDDCHIESLIFHARLAQIAEKISREVYSIKPIPDHERIAASHRLGGELRQWKASLPPTLGAINPSSLISSFRRQAIALRLAHSHAVMLAHRPFLLKNVTRDRQDMRELAKESINECIAAAQSVLESVDRMARDGRLFHAFWWTHYVCFCALVVVYVWAIQQSNRGSDADDRSYAKIFDQAERCLTHLAQATATNSPSRRYSVILQELRAEAKRRTVRRAPELEFTTATTEGHGNPIHSFQDPLPSSEAPRDRWEAMFGSPIDTTVPEMPGFLDDWQTTDWLDLDSSAFGPFPTFYDGSMTWIGDMTE